MLKFITSKIFGSHNEKELKRIQPLAEKISGLETQISRLSDEELRSKTQEFKKRISGYVKANTNESSAAKEIREKEKEALAEILPEAFATCREAAKRTLNMRHFDTQLIGGIVLHQGKIAEMSTGEGKTLVATLPVYLNALSGKGVHLITVNDYLAKRDCGWMGPVYYFLGLTCASIGHDFSVVYEPSYNDDSSRDDRMAHLLPLTRQQAYACDVTYGTNNEFGFDYLRDNMALRKEDMVQRELNFAIVDEVDSILIDEARTPLIISGPAEESTDKYYKIDKIIPRLIQGKKDETTKQESGDFIVDEKGNTAYLTEQGEVKVAGILGVASLSDLETMELKHHVDQALKAHSLFKLDVDYVVKDGEVIIVDEFTGRLMPGRRWSDGLHQAVEAKEGVKIERENQTLATITFQNYFRLYAKLAGMTGTALTEEAEFRHIYKLDVNVIPTNRPLIRSNHPDVIYKTEREKFNAVSEEVCQMHENGRPVLVGTISIDKSEKLSQLLRKKGVPHNVLNAKYHEQEATIIAQAGRLNNVTIATNMAGRGTDILLGGNADFFASALLRKKGIDPQIATKEQREKALQSVKEEIAAEHTKVVELGGLHIIGTERHEARRIDNQLRGRAGRQGDPGSSRFYLSLEDDLMRIFASDRISKFMDFFKWEEGLPIEHPMITHSIEVAQKRVESHNFEIRKQLLQYDNVMSKQREIIYEQRRKILEQENIREYILDLIQEITAEAINQYLPEKTHPADWNTAGLEEWVRAGFNIVYKAPPEGEIPGHLIDFLIKHYEEKTKAMGVMFNDFERTISLHIIDSQWKDHLHAIDTLREGIGLRAFGQKDPLVEYQHEAYLLFSEMIARIKTEALEFLFKIRTFEKEESPAGVFEKTPVAYSHPDAEQYSKKIPQKMPGAAVNEEISAPDREEPKPEPFVRKAQKVGRNDPCPCGSGKKYKKCCGINE